MTNLMTDFLLPNATLPVSASVYWRVHRDVRGPLEDRVLFGVAVRVGMPRRQWRVSR